MHLIDDLQSVLPEPLHKMLYVSLRNNGAIVGDLGCFELQSISQSRPGEAASIAAIQLAVRFQSKYKDSADVQHLHESAIADFVRIDRELVPHRIPREDINRLRDNISFMLGRCPAFEEIGCHARHGPGSSRSHSYRMKDAFYKYRSLPYEMSPNLVPDLSDYIRNDHRWRDALDYQYRIDLDIPSWSILPDPEMSHFFVPMRANHVTTVPKDSTKRRTIAKEPAYSMYVQLALHDLMSRRIKRRTQINFASISGNHALARRGSIETGYLSPATIDLSEASDRLSLSLVADVMPPDWRDILFASRSEYSDVGDRCILLSKYASMGNGTTFVVQTVVYMAMVMLAHQRANHPINFGDCLVFGDDIICPSGVVLHLYRLLELAGLKVNKEKSFTSGSIRETCGREFYRGHDVRPVFYRHDYQHDLQSYLSLRNQLWLWQERQGLSLQNTLSYLDSYLQKTPDVPASLDRSNGRFTHLLTPLSEGKRFRCLSFIGRARPLPVRNQSDYLFGKLCAGLKHIEEPHHLLDGAEPGGSVFSLSPTSSSRIRKSTTVYRHDDGIQWG